MLGASETILGVRSDARGVPRSAEVDQRKRCGDFYGARLEPSVSTHASPQLKKEKR